MNTSIPPRSRGEELFERIKSEGESAIQKLVDDRASEELFLEFKNAHKNGEGHVLSGPDRKNLARAIAGFGNSEGGIVVWGVTCKNIDGVDLPSLNKTDPSCYIADVNAFVSKLEGAVSGCTLPIHPNVTHKAIPLNDTSAKGFVVTYIPKSTYIPHQAVVAGEKDYKYLIRVRSNFESAPRGVLSAMFGRQSLPSLGLLNVFDCKEQDGNTIIEYHPLIRNEGLGIARNIFFNVEHMAIPFEKTEFMEHHFGVEKGKNWELTKTLNSHYSFASHPDLRIVPYAQQKLGTWKFFIGKEVAKYDFVFRGNVGCEGGVISHFSFTKSHELIHQAFLELKATRGGITHEAQMEFIEAIFGKSMKFR